MTEEDMLVIAHRAMSAENRAARQRALSDAQILLSALLEDSQAGETLPAFSHPEDQMKRSEAESWQRGRDVGFTTGFALAMLGMTGGGSKVTPDLEARRNGLG